MDTVEDYIAEYDYFFVFVKGFLILFLYLKDPFVSEGNIYEPYVTYLSPTRNTTSDVVPDCKVDESTTEVLAPTTAEVASKTVEIASTTTTTTTKKIEENAAKMLSANIFFFTLALLAWFSFI